MLRTLARRRFLTHISTGAVVTPWWLSGGIPAANCIAAFQPKGAASLAASYVNLASGGATWDAAPGDAPGFNTATGWDFNGSSDYLIVGSGAIATAAPLSMVCRFNVDVGAALGVFMSICNTSSANRFQFYFADQDEVIMATVATAAGAANSTAGFLFGGWYSGFGVTSAANSRAAYINGANKGTDATSLTPSGVNATYIGARYSGASIGSFLNGKMSHCAFYNIALSDAQALVLHAAMV